MSSIGKNRLAIYDLFYNHPLCDYICNNNLNILIIGNGWVGNEAFKTVFWAGQYPGVKLNITIASNNADEYEEALKEKLPGLGDFADFNKNQTSKYHYANIDICNISFDDITSQGLTDKMVADGNLSLKNQNVIVISVGDEDINCLLAEEISKHLCDSSHKVLLAVYGKEKMNVSDSNINYVSFSSDVDIDASDLVKLAENIHYMYASKYNPQANRKKEYKNFINAYQEEFLQTPEDSDDIYMSIGNFTGMNYTADSSLAQAVHMPMKLDFCKSGGTNEEKLAEIVKIINERGRKFNTLVALEHKRWNAFMAIRAVRMPKKDELGYLYSKGNNHKDSEQRLHICMCECSEDGIQLDRHSALWRQNKIPEELSDLDKVSLFCYKVLSQKLVNVGQQLEKSFSALEAFCSSNPEKTTVIREYISAARKLINDDENALNVYKFAYKNIRTVQQKKQILEITDSIDKKLQLAKLRNQRIDFLSYDAQFISMIPICMKLKDKNSTVITFTNGQAVNEVLVPWILCADSAVFVITQSGLDINDKKIAINEFFANHGDNTKIEFKEVTNEKVENIKAKIETLLSTYENVIFNIVPNMDSTVLLALGDFSEQHSMVSYDSLHGLAFYNLIDFLPRRVEDTVLNVNDYLRLVQGEIKNQCETLVPYRKCVGLENFFWKCSKVKVNDVNGKKRFYNDWNAIIINGFVQRKEVEFRNKSNRYTLPLSDSVYERDLELELIRLLKEESVIENECVDMANKKISFSTVDDDLYRFLSEKGGNLFEMLVYYRLLYTGIFGDVQTGVSFRWRSRSSDYIENEIDVVATNGLSPILVSCKTNPVIDNAFIYEIASEATSLGGIAVLATSQDLSNPKNNNHNAVVRARAMNVALIDQHIICDEQLLKKAMKQILSGKYTGPENFR